MRHRVAGRHLSRTSEHRLALRRNLVASLFEHETISTTIEKAKEVKPFAEKLITLAKKGTLAARRRAIALLGNRDIIEYENGKPVKKGTIIGKLFSELGPRYLDRPGGYTRIIRLPLRRLGDNGQLVLLQLIGPDEPVEKKSKSKRKTSRKGKRATGAKERPKPAASEGSEVNEESAQAQGQSEAAESEKQPTEAEQSAEQQPSEGEDRPASSGGGDQSAPETT